MKPGIIIVGLVALALAVVGMQDSPAQAEDPSVRFAGSNFITSSQDDGTPTPAGEASTSMQSGIAKGKFGKAVFNRGGSSGWPLPPAAAGRKRPEYDDRDDV
jgi:hypothetical protein